MFRLKDAAALSGAVRSPAGTVCAGGHAVLFFEGAGEIVAVVEAGLKGDLGDVEVGVAQ